MTIFCTFSPCRRYRFTWQLDTTLGSRVAVFCMHNPSTADEDGPDPTVARCVKYAERWGCGKTLVVNRYALRSTDPDALWRVDDPIGQENDAAIADAARISRDTGGIFVCAWGGFGKSRYQRQQCADRAADVCAIVDAVGAPMYALGVTRDNQPRHPLYLRGDAVPERWFP